MERYEKGYCRVRLQMSHMSAGESRTSEACRTIVTPYIFGGHFFFFSIQEFNVLLLYIPKIHQLYCSNIFLQNANQGHNSTFFLLTASRERRLLVYLKGGSHDGVRKAQ